MFIRVRCKGSQVLCAALLAVLLPAVIAGCGEDNGTTSMSAPTPTATARPTPTPNSGMAVRQTDLVSDVAGAAAMDPNLVNAWGIASGPTTPFWVSDNGQGVSTLYDGAGHPAPVGQPLVVTIPPPAGSPPDTTAAPTGVVFNGTSDFVIANGSNSGPSRFIFATEDGTLSGWNPTVNGGAAMLAADNSASGAAYKGLALGSTAAGNFLYAANFHQARIDAFDKTFAPVELAGSFNDPNIPAGFAPFGIQNIGGSLYVTFAKQDENKEDDSSGPGNGYVDVFDTNGNFIKRFASQGPLNSPWGLALAPATFGQFSNALLVGNFGDGRITAFNASTGAVLGQLMTTSSTPIVIEGLWALTFGNGANAGSTNTLFFTAGPGEEAHGLFGSLQAVSG